MSLIPASIKVGKASNTALALTNCLIVNKRDFPPNAGVKYILVNGRYVFTILYVKSNNLLFINLNRTITISPLPTPYYSISIIWYRWYYLHLLGISRADDSCPPGEVGAASIHRRWANLSLSEVVTITPFDPATSDNNAGNCYMGSLKLEVCDLYSFACIISGLKGGIFSKISWY